MITIKEAVTDIEKQVTYFIVESSTNSNLKNLSADEIAESGWIKNRIDTMFQENNFTINQIKHYYEQFCQKELLMELGCIDAQLEDKHLYAKNLVDSVINSIVKSSIHFQIYKLLKTLKNVSPT